MLRSVFQFESRSGFRSWTFGLVSALLFVFAIVSFLGTGGYFDDPISLGTENVLFLNTPYNLTSSSHFFMKIFLLVIVLFVGQIIHKDFKSRSFTFLYAYPITKRDYLFGKILSGIWVVTVVVFFLYLAIGVGEWMLQGSPRIAAFNLWSYISALGIYVLPNIVIFSLLLFSLVGWTRNIYAGGILMIFFVLFQFLLENVLFSSPTMLALMDPFGQNAFLMTTADWNLETKNVGVLPLDEIVVGNRLIWFGIAFGVFWRFYQTFDFQFESGFTYQKKIITSSKRIVPTSIGLKPSSSLLDFTFLGRWKVFQYLLLFELRSALQSWAFKVLAVLAVVNVLFIQIRMTQTGAFNLLPKTRLFLSAPLTVFVLVTIVMTFLLMGLSIHRAKDHRMQFMIDSTSVKNRQLIASKIGGVILIQIIMLFLFIGVCIGVQVYNGYYHFEWAQYFYCVFILTLPLLILWNITSCLVFSWSRNLFLGFGVLLLGLFAGDALGQLGIDSYLLKVNTLPDLNYSDLSEYGNSILGYFRVLQYWAVAGLITLLLIWLSWGRGVDLISDRMRWMRRKWNGWFAISLISLIYIFMGMGYFIFVEELIAKEMNGGSPKQFEDFKQKWSTFQYLAYPEIKSIQLNLDLFPSQQSFDAKAVYQLVNASGQAIDTFLLRTGFDEETRIDWNGQATRIDQDSIMNYSLFVFKNSMEPGDSLTVMFFVKNKLNTLFSRNSNVLSNGSFLKHDILPRFGYQFVDRDQIPDDSSANRHHYFHSDVDRVHIQTSISTTNDQRAIAPGELIAEKRMGDRIQFEYETPHPVKFNFSFHSGRFQKRMESYGDIDIDVLYADHQGQNVQTMIEGVKHALDFNTKWFGSYPYDAIRVVVFPHTESGFSGTLTTNNIVASEVLFDIHTEAMADRLNLPFYVMAHELTHEWFGNQLMPAEGAGAKMLTESITEYLTLCMYQNAWGAEMGQHFLDIQDKRYREGKATEKGEESPLYRVRTEQEYIAYGKGAIAFYLLEQAVGQEHVIAMLSEFFIQFQEQDIYPRTDDLIEILLKRTAATHHPLIHRLFQTTEPYELGI